MTSKAKHRKGLKASDLQLVGPWTKARRSGSNGQCVEVALVMAAPTSDEVIGVRDSKAGPHGMAFVVKKAAFGAFLAAAGNGEFGDVS
jgi:hypothetical protein